MSDNVAPSWARDGRRLYVGSNRSGHWRVWRVPLDGGRPTPVTGNGGFAAVESHDGRTLFFLKRNVPGLWKTALPPGNGEEIVLDGLRAEDWANWTVSDAGIYFLESLRLPSRGGSASTGSKPVASNAWWARRKSPTLAVSPSLPAENRSSSSRWTAARAI